VKYLLDTNVCIDFLNGRHPSVTERIRSSSPDDLYLSSVVVAELRYGADRSTRKAENHDRIDILTAEIQCLEFDLAATHIYGRLRASLETQGEPLGPYDLMIAAHALSQGLALATDNERQFQHVSGLTVENWRRL
jgi:tRNA(fMet)-specific endonuclease VapC